MSLSNESNHLSPVLSNNTKIQALELTLQQSVLYFKDLLLDFEQLHLDSENYKTQFIAQKEKCDSNNCSGSGKLKKIIESKDHIIQLVASTLIKLNETKNLSLLDKAFKILFGETNIIINKDGNKSNTTNFQSPKKEPDESTAEEISFKDESLSEIDGTPTGRTSPIIPARKVKCVVGQSEFRDKKKCPNTWQTPEKKNIKLLYTTPSRNKPSGKLRQSRIPANLFKAKLTSVVDLTCSPEYSGGLRTCKEPLMKKESVEYEDSISPSPTSAPGHVTLFKPKASPVKFKKPSLSLKIKREGDPELDEHDIENQHAVGDAVDVTEMEDSINILNQLPQRRVNSLKQQSPSKVGEPVDEDATHCESTLGISLLQDNQHGGQESRFRSFRPSPHEPQSQVVGCLKPDSATECGSCAPSLSSACPPKRPLSENINIANTPTKNNHEPNVNKMAAGDVKRKIPDVVEPLYKEPTVRNKMEKRALPGWCCDECKYFFGVLYKDDPEMMAKKISECSKHRGRQNPARAPFPPNFWNPRWEVPEDTEELNRMNNAL